MRILVESLRRSYKASKIAIEKLDAMLAEEKISQDEYSYIIS